MAEIHGFDPHLAIGDRPAAAVAKISAPKLGHTSAQGFANDDVSHAEHLAPKLSPTALGPENTGVTQRPSDFKHAGGSAPPMSHEQTAARAPHGENHIEYSTADGNQKLQDAITGGKIQHSLSSPQQHAMAQSGLQQAWGDVAQGGPGIPPRLTNAVQDFIGGNVQGIHPTNFPGGQIGITPAGGGKPAKMQTNLPAGSQYLNGGVPTQMGVAHNLQTGAATPMNGWTSVDYLATSHHNPSTGTLPFNETGYASR